MLTAQNIQFIKTMASYASDAGHIWPEFAACEAAEESKLGTSGLYILGRNPFGTKQHQTPIFETIKMPTWEVLAIDKIDPSGVLQYGQKTPDGLKQWVKVNADWVKYPSYTQAFEDRMSTLRRLAPVYPFYKAALEATSGEAYVKNVSRTWSTDPDRASKVLAYHQAVYGEAA